MKLTAFLRGINVGGHHKLPMAELRNQLAAIGCEQVQTLLNSGNVVFEINQTNRRNLEASIEKHLFQSFNFVVPVILRTHAELAGLVQQNPFNAVNIHKDIRLYVSFLRNEPKIQLTLPYYSNDRGFYIISVSNRIICSVLDLSVTKTPKGMDELEKLFGKNITTRNWNTILKIVAL
jgi:uncharacterized protein (DUF1697 family)